MIANSIDDVAAGVTVPAIVSTVVPALVTISRCAVWPVRSDGQVNVSGGSRSPWTRVTSSIVGVLMWSS